MRSTRPVTVTFTIVRSFFAVELSPPRAEMITSVTSPVVETLPTILPRTVTEPMSFAARIEAFLISAALGLPSMPATIEPAMKTLPIRLPSM
jgi:hypothetical protein